MTLYIDSTDFNAVTFILENGKRVKKVYKLNTLHSHGLLEKLEEFLNSAKVKLPQIKKLIVNKGPGSFTGTRVGVTHALALSLALGLKPKFLDSKKFQNSIA